MRLRIYCYLFIAYTIGMLFSGYIFEKPSGTRSTLLLLLTFAFLISLALFSALKKTKVHDYMLLASMLILTGIELLSKNAVNYFYHCLYLLLLILVIFFCAKSKRLIFCTLVSFCSFVKFIRLVIIHPSSSNIALSAFLVTTQVLLIIVLSLYRIYKDESTSNKELYEELLVTQFQLKQYSKELIQLTKLQEQNDIARDLHDTLERELTRSIMQMEMATKLMKEDPIKGQVLLEDAKTSAWGSLSQAKTIVDTLKKDKDFEWSQQSLMELIDHFSKTMELHISYDINGDAVSNPDIGIALYRLVQEALTNAVRHGKASMVKIYIDYQPKKVIFDIYDNGIGCNKIIYGNGIKGIQERVSALNGSLTFDGKSGFRIKGHIPYIMK